MKTPLLILLLTFTTTPVIAQGFHVGPVDTRDVLPLTAPPAFAEWWADVVALAHATPAIPFAKVEWWTTQTPIRCPVERLGLTCRVHGIFLGPKDVVLTISDTASECWVKHEMAHAILGRGDEAHDHPIFAAIWHSRACDGSRL